MHCDGCFCKEHCPAGLHCYECERELNGWLHVAESCDGFAINKKCPLEYSITDETELNKLREMIKAGNTLDVENYFQERQNRRY